MECCLHLLACNIRVELWSRASFGASAVGNLTREFVLHANRCVPPPLKLAFRKLPYCARRSAPGAEQLTLTLRCRSLFSSLRWRSLVARILSIANAGSNTNGSLLSSRAFFLKACALGVNRVVNGYNVVKERGAATDEQTGRSTSSRSKELRGSCCHRKANQVLKLVSPYSFHWLLGSRTLTAGPSYVALITRRVGRVVNNSLHGMAAPWAASHCMGCCGSISLTKLCS